MIMVTLFYFNIGIFGIQGIKTGLNDVNTFPDAAKTKEAFILLKEEFSVGDVTPAGVLSPAEIVIDGDIDSPQVAGGDGAPGEVTSGRPSLSGPALATSQ